MIDVNGKVRRLLDARKISFAPKDIALGLTGMEYGGITPLGLPESWPILADERILTHDHIVLGSGIRESKILTSTKVLASLPNVQVLDITK
jgi:prolyl-tRNA editing enzyme YbaK/EbsC (Cys-tRNA(Pro) deacylase)